MKRTRREIIRIDEDKCNGCGLCVPSCKEGALRIIDGKARLVSEVYCDGLGACLGRCPTGALTIERREADLFDEKAVAAKAGGPSQWPVQLALIPVNAPYLKDADLVLLADCAALACPGLHQEIIKGRALAIACPKLDETGPYLQKLAEIIRENNTGSIEVVIMEVPCCNGLYHLAERAVALSGRQVQLKKTVVTIQGEIVANHGLEIAPQKKLCCPMDLEST